MMQARAQSTHNVQHYRTQGNIIINCGSDHQRTFHVLTIDLPTIDPRNNPNSRTYVIENKIFLIRETVIVSEGMVTCDTARCRLLGLVFIAL